MNRSVLTLIVAAAAGILFGFGLAIAEMTNPEKVKAFLDVAAIAEGGWDPSLAFVMGGGMLVMVAFYWMAPARPVIAVTYSRPNRTRIDGSLIAGSAIFGVGWGLAGLCPGPAVADLGLAPTEVALFVAAMMIGSWATGIAVARRAAPETPRLPAGTVLAD